MYPFWVYSVVPLLMGLALASVVALFDAIRRQRRKPKRKPFVVKVATPAPVHFVSEEEDEEDVPSDPQVRLRVYLNRDTAEVIETSDELDADGWVLLP